MLKPQFTSLGLVLALSAASAACGSVSNEKSSQRQSAIGATTFASTAASQPTLLDVNDVTVLFPYSAAAGRLSPDLPLDSFISKDLFQQIVTTAKTTKVFSNPQNAPPNALDVEAYENWRIVSFRFDPCAPSEDFVSGVPAAFVGVVPGCLVELRLVAQPVTKRLFQGQAGSDSPVGVDAPQDFAAHLVFDLDVIPGSPDTATLQGQFQSSATGAALPLVQGLQAIKAASLAAGADTNGALLGVHPGLEADLAAQASNVSAEVASYLKTFLTPQRLTRATFLGIPLDSPVPWQFFGGTVQRSQDPTVAPSFVQTPLVGFASQTLAQTFFGTVSGGTPSFIERPVGTANMASLSAFTGIQGTPTPAERQNAIFGAFDIEHPSAHNALTTDCASCHTTQVFHGPPSGSSLPFQDLADHTSIHIQSLSDLSPARFVPPPGVSGYIASNAFDASGWNVHNLGYLGTHARVSERVLNETAAVVDLVNRLLAGDGHQNPGLDCGTDRATLDGLYLCQLAAPSDAARRACFAGCTIPEPTCTPGTPNVCGGADACATAYAQADCLTFVQGRQVSRNGHNWTCTNGNCMNCAGFESCAPGGSGCPWGVVWTDQGACN